MEIFHRAKSGPTKNASRSVTVRVNFSGRNRICDAVPATIIVSRKIVLSCVPVPPLKDGASAANTPIGTQKIIMQIAKAMPNIRFFI